MGPRIEIEIEGVDKLDREIRNWNERLHKELQKVVKRMEGAIEREVKANIAVDSGALGASVYGFSSVRTGKGAIKAKFRGKLDLRDKSDTIVAQAGAWISVDEYVDQAHARRGIEYDEDRVAAAAVFASDFGRHQDVGKGVFEGGEVVRSVNILMYKRWRGSVGRAVRKVVRDWKRIHRDG